MSDWLTTRTCEQFPYPAHSLAAGGYAEFCVTHMNWGTVAVILFGAVFMSRILSRVIAEPTNGK